MGNDAAAADAGSGTRMIVHDLRNKILEGVLPPNLQLLQSEIADQYGVSRIPVREALNQLKAEGLVTLKKNRGAFVAGVTLDELYDSFDIRIALETHALRLAVPRYTAHDLNELQAILDEYDESISPHAWRDLNLRFHMGLYTPCARPRLLKLIEDNVLSNSRFLRTYVSLVSGKTEPQRDHHQILDACAAGNVGLAVGILEDHINATRRALVNSNKELQSRHATL
ncbi:GntR family transcriptional regulator [Castellaniella sp.]|uniref:GntR family transcriptional regulator n=1 Tax=Castellaniella sp. TaxID=1955812 RepID=UPI00355F2836